MVTARGRSYEAQAFDGVDQPKCLAHLLRSIREVVAGKSGRARDLGEQLKALGQEALALGHAPHDATVTDVNVAAEALQAELTYQLRARHLKDPDNQRLLNALGWHHDRGHLLRFLADPRIEPTNNRAERALRPAVMARKVSHGSKHDRGAYTFAAFTRVVRTLAKHSTDVLVEGLYHLFRIPSLQGTPP
jgi:transposase